MKTANNIASLAFRVLLHLVSCDFLLPFVGLRPHIECSSATLLTIGVALVWTYWIALAAVR